MKKVKEIFLPDLGEGIDSATISEISVSNEQTVKKDDIIILERVTNYNSTSFTSSNSITSSITCVIV